ncbi:response regulator [Phenylobacterium sp.]|uniref:response regulator n=1 Tax=Phenylobacterium sp. TaxID=1871053 RepID=UPI0025D8CAD6|nr:response regulator [Phenylobacterium sp.]
MPKPTSLDGPAPAETTLDPTQELKDLLGVLTGVCEALGEGHAPRSEAGEVAHIGLSAAARATQIVARLQDAGREREARSAPVLGLVPAPAGQAGVVLIVDDEPDLLKLMTAAFARAGFKAYSARNGRMAVQLVKAVTPDLMVTDIVMPEKEGIATIIEAKAAAPDMGIIAISGGGAYGRTSNFLQWAEELGAERVMAKPFPMSQLLDAARDVLARRGRSNADREVAG